MHILYIPLKGQESHMTFILLELDTLIYVFMGSMSSFYQDENHKFSDILHTGPFKVWVCSEASPHRPVALDK